MITATWAVRFHLHSYPLFLLSNDLTFRLQPYQQRETHQNDAHLLIKRALIATVTVAATINNSDNDNGIVEDLESKMLDAQTKMKAFDLIFHPHVLKALEAVIRLLKSRSSVSVDLARDLFTLVED